MARSRGTVRKRCCKRKSCNCDPQRWLVRVYLGQDHNGKRKYTSKTIRGTSDEAQEALTEILYKTDRGEYVEPSSQTVNEFLDYWLKEHRSDVSPKTFRNYKGLMRVNVRPRIGHRKLQTVTEQDWSDIRDWMFKDRGLSVGTVTAVYRVFKLALRFAHARGYISRDVTTHMKNPRRNPYETTAQAKARTDKVEFLTVEQTRELLSKAREVHDPLYPLWTLLMGTGARPGEALALSWGDVDLDEGWLTINKSCTRDRNGSWVVKRGSKTSSGNRRISIPLEALEALKAHRVTQLERMMARGIRTDLVFSSRKGTPIQDHRIRRRWKKACKRAGVPQVKLYATRHSHATHLLEKGVNPKLVQERLGHSTVALTLDTYSHAIPSMQETVRDVASVALA